MDSIHQPLGIGAAIVGRDVRSVTDSTAKCDGAVTADHISWVPRWADELSIDRGNVLGMNDVELIAYALDLQRRYRSLRELWSVTMGRLKSRTGELTQARRVIEQQRGEIRSARVSRAALERCA